LINEIKAKVKVKAKEELLTKQMPTKAQLIFAFNNNICSNILEFAHKFLLIFDKKRDFSIDNNSCSYPRCYVLELVKINIKLLDKTLYIVINRNFNFST
jgi:hypothetical protein